MYYSLLLLLSVLAISSAPVIFCLPPQLLPALPLLPRAHTRDAHDWSFTVRPDLKLAPTSQVTEKVFFELLDRFIQHLQLRQAWFRENAHSTAGAHDSRAHGSTRPRSRRICTSFIVFAAKPRRSWLGRRQPPSVGSLRQRMPLLTTCREK